MSQEIWELWVEGYCGLVCPFPRLTAMRMDPKLAEFYTSDEIVKMIQEEQAYNRKKADARHKLQKLLEAKE